MKFTDNLFWDIDINELDFNKHAQYIIVRVFERGKLEDLRQVIEHYGKEKIITALTSTKFLNKLTLSFASGLLGVDKENFECYRHSQSIPQLWDY